MAAGALDEGASWVGCKKNWTGKKRMRIDTAATFTVGTFCFEAATDKMANNQKYVGAKSEDPERRSGSGEISNMMATST